MILGKNRGNRCEIGRKESSAVVTKSSNEGAMSGK